MVETVVETVVGTVVGTVVETVVVVGSFYCLKYPRRYLPKEKMVVVML